MQRQAMSVCGKLTDFGSARTINILRKNLTLTNEIGTPIYIMTSEILDTKLQHYSFPVDIYSFEMILYQCFLFNDLYNDKTQFKYPWAVTKFVAEGNRLPRLANIPNTTWELISTCWSQDIETRPNANELIETMENAFSSTNHDQTQHPTTINFKI